MAEPRKTIAMYWAASCGGCEIALLEVGERILDVAAAADLVFCPCLVDTKTADVEAMPDGAIDLCFFDGAIRTEENARMAALLRRKSKRLVAFGACAGLGGVPGLSNASPLEATLGRVYGDGGSVVNPDEVRPGPDALLPNGEPARLPALRPRVGTLAAVVPIDHVMPGCPPEAHQVEAVLDALLGDRLPEAGALVGAGTETVCEECRLDKESRRLTTIRRPHEVLVDGRTCLLEQGVVCLGIGTRSGCGGRCPDVGMPCRGCYGPSGAAVDQGLGLVGAVAGALAPEDPAAIAAMVAEVADPVGTFYRFGLPASMLGGRIDDGPTREGQG